MRKELDEHRQSYTGKYEHFIKKHVDGWAEKVNELNIIQTIQLDILHSDDGKN